MNKKQLPGIQENNSAYCISFQPKSRDSTLKSRSNPYLDILKKKLRELQGPKQKLPECVILHLKQKRKLPMQTFTKGFPCLEDMMPKILGNSLSPLKIRPSSSFSPSKRRNLKTSSDNI